MQTAYATATYSHWVVVLSYLIASFASYVAIDLARRVRGQDRAVARAWWLGGSIAMGTGIWSMHFVGMLAVSLPFAVGYGYALTIVSWLAAVAVSGIGLYIAGRSRLRAASLAGGSVAMGAGICAMHYLGMASMQLAPGIRWNASLVAASAVVAVTASAVALVIFFELRRFSGVVARYLQIGAALVMGAAIAGMHYTGMAAAHFDAGSVCLSAGQLSGDGLGALVAVATVVLLSMTMFTSLLDARHDGRQQQLAAFLNLANAELQQLAFHDPLTKLPNRLLLHERLGSALERRRLGRERFSVLFVNLDGFDRLRKQHGRLAAEAVVQEVARRLSAVAGTGNTAARIGADEFVLLLEDADDPAVTAHTAQTLIDAVLLPVPVAGRAVQVGCWVGIAVSSVIAACDQLLADAESAMHRAQRSGGASFCFFESDINDEAREQIDLQRELRIAIDTSQLELYYQPKIDLHRGSVTGVETLVRWRHPQRGVIEPAVFLPVAERFGLAQPLGNWIIEEACAQAAIWQMLGQRLRVAINLSAQQLRQDDLAAVVRTATERWKLAPSCLTFEIAEMLPANDQRGIFERLGQLARLGVGLSMDSFGAGYSNLHHLRRMPVGELKIQRSFVQDIEASDDARAIVEAAIQLAHALGMRVVAKGVETPGQKEVLAQLKCDEIQGFLVAEPMNSSRMTEWVAAKQMPALPKKPTQEEREPSSRQD